MARFTAAEAENYGGQGGGGFFSLRDDGDVATVRFMYSGIEDVVGDSVHEIKGTDGKKRYVSCLRTYNEPIAKCPMCAAGSAVQAKLFIPVYDVESGQVKTWERGKKFFGKMSSLCSRYSNEKTPLVGHTFEIERHGAKGSTDTFYEIYETGCDNTTLEDLPELPNLENFVLELSEDEMEDVLAHGYSGNSQDEEQPIRRRERPQREESQSRRRREAF